MNVYKIVLEDEEDQYVEYVYDDAEASLHRKYNDEILRNIVTMAILRTKQEKGHMDFGRFYEILEERYAFKRYNMIEANINLCEMRR